MSDDRLRERVFGTTKDATPGDLRDVARALAIQTQQFVRDSIRAALAPLEQRLAEIESEQQAQRNREAR